MIRFSSMAHLFGGIQIAVEEMQRRTKGDGKT
jgi:hypothetical protein